jgi:hypothetical protein
LGEIDIQNMPGFMRKENAKRPGETSGIVVILVSRRSILAQSGVALRLPPQSITATSHLDGLGWLLGDCRVRRGRVGFLQ